jgi:predicted PurR-regulated permease PerM
MDTAAPAEPQAAADGEDARIADTLVGVRLPGGRAMTVLAVLAVLYTLYFAAAIVLPFVLATVLFLLLSPLMRLLSKRLRLPRPFSAMLLILLLFAVVAGLGAAVSLPASGWIARAPDSLPMLEKKLGFLAGPINFVQHGMEQLNGLLQRHAGPQIEGEIRPVAAPPSPSPSTPPTPQSSASDSSFSTLRSFGGSVLMTTGAAVGQVFTVLLLLFFLLSSGDTLLRRLVEVLPTFEDKKRAVEIAAEIERNVAGYLATITMMNAMVGILAGLVMWALGLPDPLLFGTLAFLLNYIPIIGPVIGIVIFFFVGLFTFESPLSALAPAGIYLGIHVMEGEAITPMLLARRLTLNPVLVIVSLLFWNWMWGVTGALLSVPLLAVFKIVCDHLPGLHALGHMLGAKK